MSVGSESESIFSFYGSNEGPSVFIIGGTHGNETIGVQVVSQFLDSLKSKELSLKAGRITLAFGNPNAIANNERYLKNGLDLNRCFTKDVHQKDSDVYEFKRAQELAHIIEDSDITLDLHSTSKPSKPFISAKADSAHERIYRWFEHEIVLEDPNYVLAGDVASSDEYADYKNKIGICFENSYIGDSFKIENILASINALLYDLNIVESNAEVKECIGMPIYTLKHRIDFNGDEFYFAPQKGEYNFQPIQEGEVVAYQDGDEVIAPYNGVIVFPKLKKFWEQNKPVCYFAKLK